MNESNNMNELNNINDSTNSNDYQEKEKKNNKKWLLLLLLLLFLCLFGYLVFRIAYSAGTHTRPVTPSPIPQKLLIKITDENGEWKTIGDSTGKIQVSPMGLSLEKNESMDVYAITTIPGTIQWTSSDESCIKVEPTEGGESTITALKDDCTAVITAKVDGVVSEIVVNAIDKHDKLKGIQLNKEKYVIEVGGKELVSVMAVPTTAELPELVYKIENTNIATVDKNGVIRGIKEGTTKLIVSTADGSFKTTATVVVKKKTSSDDKIIINPNRLSLEPNEEQQIYATATTNQPITWASSDESCVTVSPKTGTKPTVKAGNKNCTAVIFAKSGDATGEVVVNVVKTHDDLTGIQLNKENYVIEVGKTELVSTIAVPTTAELPELIYKITDTSIATVDANGVITGVSVGTTTITVSTADGSFTATATVTIKESSDKIVINPSSLSLEPNEGQQIYATTTTDQPITWTSSDESCATVSPKTGAEPTIKAGNNECTATIVATSGNATSEIVVNVVRTHDDLTGIQLNKENYIVDVGKTELVSVLPVPTTAELPELIYRIEDTSIATVDANGVITGVSVGTTTITVSTADGSFTATATITVKEESSDLINQLNIFATTTSSREYIAPYDTGSYIFSVENAVSSDITYTLSLEEENEDRVNIKYKLKKNGNYIINEWTRFSDVHLDNVALAANATDNFELEWSWVSEDDELDTQIGLKRERAVYTLTIKVVAVQD